MLSSPGLQAWRAALGGKTGHPPGAQPGGLRAQAQCRVLGLQPLRPPGCINCPCWTAAGPPTPCRCPLLRGKVHPEACGPGSGLGFAMAGPASRSCPFLSLSLSAPVCTVTGVSPKQQTHLLAHQVVSDFARDERQGPHCNKRTSFPSSPVLAPRGVREMGWCRFLFNAALMLPTLTFSSYVATLNFFKLW